MMAGKQKYTLEKQQLKVILTKINSNHRYDRLLQYKQLLDIKCTTIFLISFQSCVKIYFLE